MIYGHVTYVESHRAYIDWLQRKHIRKIRPQQKNQFSAGRYWTFLIDSSQLGYTIQSWKTWLEHDTVCCFLGNHQDYFVTFHPQQDVVFVVFFDKISNGGLYPNCGWEILPKLYKLQIVIF